MAIYKPPEDTAALQPYIHGYTLLIRDGVTEIWHYASDRLVHVEKDLLKAVRWANNNSAIPKSAQQVRRWHELMGHP